MTLKIGDWEFDHASYDKDGDVLYLSIGESRPGIGEETPEGHVLRFDESGEFCGLTLIGVRRTLDAEGSLSVTVPHRENLASRDLEPALG